MKFPHHGDRRGPWPGGPLGGRQRGAGGVRGRVVGAAYQYPRLPGSGADLTLCHSNSLQLLSKIVFLPLPFCDQFRALCFTPRILDVIRISLVVNHSSRLYHT